MDRLISSFVQELNRAFRRKKILKKIIEDIDNRMHGREYILTILLTAMLLLLSFVGYTKFTAIQIADRLGVQHDIHISYYGFPFQMIGILNPIGDLEAYYLGASGAGLVRILWDGLFLNFFLFFGISFAIVYASTRLKG